jgi:lactoylglutathione lyase
MKLEFTKIDYVMTVVQDMSRSLEFYRDILGIPLKFHSDGWAELGTGTTTLALHGAGKPKAAENVPGPHRDLAGTCSIGFRVDDVHAVFDHLKSKGVPFTLPPTPRRNEGIMLAIATDPDGLEISFTQSLNN